MMDYRFFSGLGLLAISSAVLLSCGDDNPPAEASEDFLVQDVRYLKYQLQTAKWELEVRYFNSAHEKIMKEIQFKGPESKDVIERILEGGRFLLVTNGVKAPSVVITPEGNLEDHSNAKQELTGCKLEGKSEISGKASHLKLEMNWQLEAKLDGGGCKDLQKLKDDFNGFVTTETARLNLKSASDLFKALDQDYNSISSLKLKLKINGETDPEAKEPSPAPAP